MLFAGLEWNELWSFSDESYESLSDKFIYSGNMEAPMSSAEFILQEGLSTTLGGFLKTVTTFFVQLL